MTRKAGLERRLVGRLPVVKLRKSPAAGFHASLAMIAPSGNGSVPSRNAFIATSLRTVRMYLILCQFWSLRRRQRATGDGLHSSNERLATNHEVACLNHAGRTNFLAFSYLH
jgi:hypothetical protein